MNSSLVHYVTLLNIAQADLGEICQISTRGNPSFRRAVMNHKSPEAYTHALMLEK